MSLTLLAVFAVLLTVKLTAAADISWWLVALPAYTLTTMWASFFYLIWLFNRD